MSKEDFYRQRRLAERVARETPDEVRLAFDTYYARLQELGEAPKPVVPLPPMVLAELGTYYAAYLRAKRHAPRYTTGFRTLDTILGGLSSVTVLLGMPGQGKTTFALQTMLDQLEIGTPVLFLSFDITRRDVITHFMRRLTGLSFAAIMDATPGMFFDDEETSLSVGDQENYRAALGHLQVIGERMLVMSPEETGDVTEDALRRAITDLTTCYERAPLIVVDYLGALAPHMTPADQSTERIEKTAHLISKLALELDAPWLVLSQRSRANYGNAGLDGGKGSGEIEAKAFTVLSLDKRMDVPDIIDYPAWVKTAEQKAKYAAQVHGVERTQALLAGTRPSVSSRLVLHINKDRNALGGGATGSAINFIMDHGWLVEEPLEMTINLFGDRKGAV